MAAVDLRDFVSETLRAIINGIVDAQTDEAVGEFVGRAGVRASDRDLDGNTLGSVEFDVATTAEERTSGEAKAKIKVVSIFEAGGGVADARMASAVNRIKFAVPIGIPKPDPQKRSDSVRQARRAQDDNSNVGWMGR